MQRPATTSTTGEAATASTRNARGTSPARGLTAAAFAFAFGALEPPLALAGAPTGAPAANPAHPVWNSNEPRQPKIEHRPLRAGQRTQIEQPHLSHEMPQLPSHPTPGIHQPDPAVASATPLAPPLARPPAALVASTLDRHQRAEQAYQSARALLAGGKHIEAVEQLDMAVELDPGWSAPVRLRAHTFGELALRYRPSAALLSAQAADLQRLLTLEPNVEVVARTQQVIALRRSSERARHQEERRRRMVKPALIVGSLSVALLVGGVFLAAGVYPSTEPDALRQRSMVVGGIVMTSVGAAIAPAAITLGVLAGRQARRDQAAREMNARTGRPQPTLGLAPRFFPGGGGLGAQLRF